MRYKVNNNLYLYRIIGTVEININIAKRQCLYSVDEHWAASKGFDIRKYKMFLDNISLSYNNR